MLNLETRKFRETLIKVTNESPLPIEIKRLVFLEVMGQVEKASEDAIRQKLEEMKKETEVNEDGN